MTEAMYPHFKRNALESMNSRKTLGMVVEEVGCFLFIYFLLSHIVPTLAFVHDTASSSLHSSLASSGAIEPSAIHII